MCAGCINLLEAELASYAIMHVTREKLFLLHQNHENFYKQSELLYRRRQNGANAIPREQACGRWTFLGLLRTPSPFRYVRSVWHEWQFGRVWLHIWSRYVLSGKILHMS